MIKNVLVPMGNSDFSHNALRTAVKLGNLFNAHLRLLYVEDISRIKEILFASRTMGGVSLDLPGISSDDGEVSAIREEIAREKAEVQKYYDEIKNEIRGTHTLIFREGETAQEILRDAKLSDLIIMGKVLRKSAQDCSDLQPAIIEVVHKSQIPLLAVCEGTTLGEHALIAYDGSHSSINALRILGNFIPDPVKKLTVLTVQKKEEEALAKFEEAEQYLTSFGVPVEKVWKKDDHVTEVILAQARDLNASAIVIGGYGDNKLKEMLVGSTTGHVLKSVHLPVLMSNG